MATYTIIGGDQKPYSSVTADDIRRWIADGRLNEQSLMKAQGDAEFRPIPTFPEFADALAAKAVESIAPPTLPAGPAGPPKRAAWPLPRLFWGFWACSPAV